MLKKLIDVGFYDKHTGTTSANITLATDLCLRFHAERRKDIWPFTLSESECERDDQFFFILTTMVLSKPKLLIEKRDTSAKA